MKRWWSATLLALLLAPPSLAHERSTSYSSWEIRGPTARVTLRLLEVQIANAAWLADAGTDRDQVLAAHVARQLQLLAGGRPCAVTDGPRRLESEAGRIAVEWGVTCPDATDLQIRSEVLLDVTPSHLHFARVSRDGGRSLERLLSGNERTWSLSDGGSTATAGQPTGTSLLGYVGLGFEHILTGYDHLAFVLALILIGGSVAEIAKVVTGFTVAHSITLGLAVLGYIRPERAPVEALIGLSIALVATENIWLLTDRRRLVPGLVGVLLLGLAAGAARGYGSVPAVSFAGLALFTVCYFGLLRHLGRAGALRWCIAFIFGLIHGFGFASVLQEAGLPADRIVAALFGFNIGVELGQLAVVVLVWPLLRVATRGREAAYRAVVEIGSAAIVALGVFWFVTRAYG